MTYHFNDPLNIIKVQFRANIRAGQTICPVCDRTAAIRNILFTKTLLGNLVFLSRFDGFIHLPSYGNRALLTSNSTGKLKYWGLAEPEPNKTDPKKFRSGSWRITDIGQKFLHGMYRIPERLFIYNDTVLSMEPAAPTISIHSEMLKGFDFQEAMKSADSLIKGYGGK